MEFTVSYLNIDNFQIQINVKDINDNAPEFDSTAYIAVVLENVVPETSVLNVSAHDPDEGSAGLVHYKLVDEKHLQGIFIRNLFIFKYDSVTHKF